MDSYFQNGVKLKGTLTVNGTVHFDGEIEGEILASDHLIIGEMGRVKGNIQTRNITNLGKIRGNITAENRVSLAQGSDLEGDILTGHLVVEEGCRFEGRCRMHQKAPAKTAAPVQSTLAEALPKIEEVPGEVASPPAEPEPVLEKPRKKKRWAGPVAAGVLLAAGVGGWYLYPSYFGESIEVLINRGQSLIAQKKYSDAELEFRKALKITRNNPKVYAGLGDVYLQKKEYNEALTQFQRSIELEPSATANHIKLAKAYTAKGKFQEAANVYQAALDLDPKNYLAFYDMGQLKIKEGKK